MAASSLTNKKAKKNTGKYYSAINWPTNQTFINCLIILSHWQTFTTEIFILFYLDLPKILKNIFKMQLDLVQNWKEKEVIWMMVTRIVEDYIKVKDNYKSSKKKVFFDVGFVIFWFNGWHFLIGNYQSD